MPDGPPGRVAVRDAVHCGDAWWAVGGVVLDAPTETQDARPAAWRSADGSTWEALPVAATTYWGRRAILSGIACSGEHGGGDRRPLRRRARQPAGDDLLREGRRARRPAGALQPVRRGHRDQRRPAHRGRAGLARHRQPHQRARGVALRRRAGLHHRGGRARPGRRGGLHLARPGGGLGRGPVGGRGRRQRHRHPRSRAGPVDLAGRPLLGAGRGAGDRRVRRPGAGGGHRGRAGRPRPARRPLRGVAARGRRVGVRPPTSARCPRTPPAARSSRRW